VPYRFCTKYKQLVRLEESGGCPQHATPRMAWAISSESSSWTAMWSEDLAPAMKSIMARSRSSGAPRSGCPA
jgi:hypothetical protein